MSGSLRYPFVLLDVGETLVGPLHGYGTVYARVLRGIGLDLEQERLERAIRDVAARVSREIPAGRDRFGHFAGGETEFWRRFCARTIETVLGRPADAERVDLALAGLAQAFADPAAWHVYPDVVPALEALRAAGARMAVVSNWDSRLPCLLERLGLAGYFEAVGVSHLEGLEKPAPEFFLRLLARLGGSRDLALHVGNDPELDGRGARSAGIDALLVDRTRALGRSHGTHADLRHLPAVVRDGLDAVRA